MDECPFCFAQVMADSFGPHVEWHWIHGLHRPDCGKVRARAQREVYGESVLDQPCSCGLAGMPAPTP